MTILYRVHHNLYVNLTNRCPCACTFCLRQTRDEMESSGSLWLEHEPTVQEVIHEFSKFNLADYKEIVFCGFGEPTERLDDLLAIAAYLKNHVPNPIRINTNGLGNLVNNRDITPEFQGLIDSISISLNTPDKERYYELTKSKFGIDSFDAILDFAKKSTAYVNSVAMTTVATTISEDEEARCHNLCNTLGVQYRIRPWED